MALLAPSNCTVPWFYELDSGLRFVVLSRSYILNLNDSSEILPGLSHSFYCVLHHGCSSILLSSSLLHCLLISLLLPLLKMKVKWEAFYLKNNNNQWIALVRFLQIAISFSGLAISVLVPGIIISMLPLKILGKRFTDLAVVGLLLCFPCLEVLSTLLQRFWRDPWVAHKWQWGLQG